MGVRVWVGSEPAPSGSKDAAVFREEAVDDSGQPSMVGEWKFFEAGANALLSRGTRIVIEQYDKDRHGRID